jgi:hypothetical protein
MDIVNPAGHARPDAHTPLDEPEYGTSPATERTGAYLHPASPFALLSLEGRGGWGERGNPVGVADGRGQTRVALAILSVVLAASAFLPPPQADGRIMHLPSICPFYTLTGLPCPGCGLTRSFVCLAHGRFAESFHWHPLGPILFVLAVFFWVDSIVRLRLGRPLFSPPARVKSFAFWAGAGVFLAFGIVRMVTAAVTHVPF